MTNEQIINALAAIGIYAMYGGSKGRGFWLYRGMNAVADEAIRSGNGFDMMCNYPAGFECIKNDGKSSGNEYFTMCQDAIELLKRNTK